MITATQLQPTYDYCVKRFHIKEPPRLELLPEIKIDWMLCDGLYIRQKHLIQLRSTMPLGQAIESLIHEFIHVHQYNCGKLKLDGKGGQIWKNKPYIAGYWDVPWEISARHLTEKVYRQAMKTCLPCDEF